MENFEEILKNKKRKKAPAYPWQDLALKIIQELKIPNFKKSSIFKICKETNPNLIKNCLNDTKELCKQEQKWQYFFKLVHNLKK